MAAVSTSAMVTNNGYVNSSEDFEKWIRMATDNVSVVDTSFNNMVN